VAWGSGFEGYFIWEYNRISERKLIAFY
jgi:hypothetical protein